jgi:hypothetical protein
VASAVHGQPFDFGGVGETGVGREKSEAWQACLGKHKGSGELLGIGGTQRVGAK